MSESQLVDVLTMAIGREQEAFEFYSRLLTIVMDSSARETLTWIAEEEKRHETFLTEYRNGKLSRGALALRTAVDYKTASYLDEPEVSQDMSRPEVFLLAAHREQRSHGFYMKLADMHPDGETADMLKRMASEELQHKEKMEYLYANTAFPQTDGG